MPVQEVIISQRSLIRRKSTITFDLMPEDIGYINNDRQDPESSFTEESIIDQ